MISHIPRTSWPGAKGSSLPLSLRACVRACMHACVVPTHEGLGGQGASMLLPERLSKLWMATLVLIFLALGLFPVESDEGQIASWPWPVHSESRNSE